MTCIEDIPCFQCGTRRDIQVCDVGMRGEASQRRHAIESAGWWEYSERMRFCPSCRGSARLALGVDVAGAAG